MNSRYTALGICILFIFSVLVSAVEIDYELTRGWNMIAFPCVSSEANIADVFSPIPPAYSFNPGTGAYTEIAGFPEYHEGIWILMDRDTVIPVDCTPPWTGDTVETLPVRGEQILTGAEFDTTLCVADMDDGGCAVFTHIVDTTEATGLKKLGIIMLDRTNRPVWAKLYSLGPVTGATFLPDGGLICIGVKTVGLAETYIMRLDSLGVPIWSESFTSPFTGSVAKALAMDGGSFVLASGTQLLSLSGDGELLRAYGLSIQVLEIYHDGPDGIRVVGTGVGGALDGSGFVTAEMNLSGSIGSVDHYTGVGMSKFRCFAETVGGDILAGGSSYASALGTGRIAKVSSSGDIVWSRVISSEVENSIEDIDVDEDGNVQCTGNFDGDIFSLKLSGGGEILSANSFIGRYMGMDDTEKARHIRASEDGLFIFGYKENWGILNQLTAIFTSSEGTTCNSRPLPLTLEDSELTSSTESATVDVIDLELLDISVETSNFGINGYFLCR